jgi:hypothetical protein
MDLNAEIANALPAWKVAIVREQQALARAQSRGPRRAAVPADASPAFADTVLADAQAAHLYEMIPIAQRIAVYTKAVELASEGILPLFDAPGVETNEFRSKYHEMLQGAMTAGRFRRVGRRELDETALDIMETT